MKTSQLIKEMNEYSVNLTQEHRTLFEEILLKIRFSKLYEKDAEEFSHHCLNLFLQAEAEGMDVSEVLGAGDADNFCREYIEEVRSGYSPLKKALLSVQFIPMAIGIFTGAWEMLVGYLVPAVVRQKALVLDVPVTISMSVNTLFALVLLQLALNHIPGMASVLTAGSKKEERKLTLALACGWLLITGFFVASKLMLREVLFSVNFAAFITAIVFLHVSGKLLLKKID
jgi:DNA-binding ferritin-like protein (Dps family)